MALNADGFEGGAILTLEQQAQLRVKQYEATKDRPEEQPESAVPAKRKRKTSADQLAVTEATEESPKSE